MSLEDLLNLEVTVASNFSEIELTSRSTVDVVLNSQWRDYGATNVSEAISHQPGIMIYPVPWGGSAIAIRGYASSLSVRGIATLLDDIPLNSYRAGTALYDIRGFAIPSMDRIEMIRGPGSALYGSDAFHGVLSMKTYESENNNNTVLADLSSEGLKVVNANHTTLLNDGISVHATVSSVNQSPQDIPFTYTIPGTNTERTSTRSNAYDAYTGAFKIKVTHSDKVKSKMGIYFKGHESRESVSAGQSFSPFGSIFLDKDITDGIEDMQALNTALEIDLGNNFIFESKGFYWTEDYKLFSDTTPLPAVGVYTINLGAERHWGANLLIKQLDNAWNTQWSLSLDYKTGELVGNRAQFAISSEDRAPIAERINPQQGFERDVKGLIVSAKTHFLDKRLQLVYGGRLDHYSDFGNQTTPRYGIIYLPSERSVIKFLFGEAFRAPIASEIYGANNLKGNPNLKPELMETSEFIYIYQNDNWKLNITYFQSDWNNGIILVPIVDPNFSSEYDNVGKNKADGFEFSWRGGIDNWRWDLSASFVSSEAITSTGNIDYSAFPEKIINANFGYQLSGIDIYVTQRIHQSVTEGPTNNNVPSPQKLENYYATDITFDWNINKHFNIQLGVKNLFDRENFVPGVWNNENGVMILGRHFQAGFIWQPNEK